MSEVIGTVVNVPGAIRCTGVLRYIGPIRDKPGTFAGIELQGPVAASRGKNNGDVEGVQYFQVSQPMSGLFLPWDRLKLANGSLPSMDRVVSRSIKRELIHTPSPASRSVSRAFSPMNRQVSRSLSLASRTSLRSRGSLVQSPPQDPKSVFGRAHDTDYNLYENNGESQTGHLQQTIEQLRGDLAVKEIELAEKEAILTELQSAVRQVDPALEELENELEEKDRRIRKQKQEFDRAREEWRLSLDLMITSQQESEELYEAQIEDLKQELAELRSHKGTDPLAADSVQARRFDTERQALNLRIHELEAQVEALTNELRQEIKAVQAPPDANAEQVLELLLRIDLLSQDVALGEIVLKSVQEKSRAKDARIAELESRVDDFESKELEQLLAQVSGIELTGPNEIEAENASLREQVELLRTQLELQQASAADTNPQKEAELQKEIEDLRHQLEMRPSFDELIELQTSLEELDAVHQRSLEDKTKSIEELQREKEEAETQRKTLDEQLAQLRDELAAEKLAAEKLAAEKVEAEKRAEEAAKAHASPVSKAPQQISGYGNGGVPIYVPANKTDPSFGRTLWCGLCERDGHDSLHCPYENEMF